LLIRTLRRMARAAVLMAVVPGVPQLSVAQQQAIADAFAPTFVFHRAETLFPVSPLFPETGEAMDFARLRTRAAVVEALGSSRSRTAAYRGLTLVDKLRAAAVTYRVYAITERGQARLIVEYWCHYVFNDYNVRLGWFPVRFPAAHQQDLESVRVVLAQRGAGAWLDAPPTAGAARRAFDIVDILASAHAGTVPPNRVTAAAARRIELPFDMLVERGSHAMAADLDRDGLFTRSADAPLGGAFVWGIRDHGALGVHYKDVFSDSRAGAGIVRLCGPDNDDTTAETGACSPYKLERADEIDAWFGALQLDRAERRTVHGSAGWLAPVFIDRDHKDLLVPPDRQGDDAVERLMARPSASERGWLAGLTTSRGKATAVVGRQHAFLTEGRAPDWFLDAAVRMRWGDRPAGTASVAATYPLDAITRLVVSSGWLSDSQRASGGRLDAFAGAQFHVGHVRVRSGYRIGAHAFDTIIFGVF
jgi:hypothetical protein